MSVKIKNEMETAVRAEVSRQRRRATGWSRSPWFTRGVHNSILARLLKSERKRAGACWCVVCDKDVMALSLTTLPPCYCRSQHYGVTLDRIETGELASKVKGAVRKVNLRPRHPSRLQAPGNSEICLIDYGLREGLGMIGPLLRRMPGTCNCRACREDTLALALNSKSPRYGVEILGRMRMPLHEMDFFRHELLETLSVAAKTVARNPRHGGKDTA